MVCTLVRFDQIAFAICSLVAGVLKPESSRTYVLKTMRLTQRVVLKEVIVLLAVITVPCE